MSRKQDAEKADSSDASKSCDLLKLNEPTLRGPRHRHVCYCVKPLRQNGNLSIKERQRRSELARSLPRGPDGKFISRYAASLLPASNNRPPNVPSESKKKISESKNLADEHVDDELPKEPTKKRVKQQASDGYENRLKNFGLKKNKPSYRRSI